MARRLTVLQGKAKAKKLHVPDSARPMMGKLKRAIFDTLGENIQGKSVLDLFAGAGTMGIEAMSRGAESAVFVDMNPEAVELIKDNLIRAELVNNTRVYLRPALEYVRKTKDKYDLIFLDPPFADARLFPLRIIPNIMHDNSVIMFRIPKQQSHEIEIPGTLEVLDQRKYGNSVVIWLSRRTADTLE